MKGRLGRWIEKVIRYHLREGRVWKECNMREMALWRSFVRVRSDARLSCCSTGAMSVLVAAGCTGAAWPCPTAAAISSTYTSSPPFFTQPRSSTTPFSEFLPPLSNLRSLHTSKKFLHNSQPIENSSSPSSLLSFVCKHKGL